VNIVIEKGIPCPSKQGGRKRVWPLHEMEVGDSFLIPKGRDNACRVSAIRMSKNGKQFLVRACIDGTGYRCWRIA